MMAMPAAAVLFVLRGALGSIRTPRWLLAAVCGLASLFVSMYLLLAAGSITSDFQRNDEAD